MAAPNFNITGYLTEIDDGDTGTGWNVTDVDTDIKVEGIGAGFDAIRDGGTITYTFGTAVDMSGIDMHIRQWLMHTFPANLQTKANGGIQLFISDGSNTAYWYVGGSDTHGGSWELFQADLAATPDLGTLPTLTTITTFGFVLDHLTAARNVANTYWDICTFAKGYEIYGGTSSDEVSWLTVAVADTGTTASVQYGITELIKGGAFYINSGIFLGDSAGTSDLYFDGTNQTIIFYDSDEKLGLYKIVGTGNGTGVTHINLSGAVIKSAGSPFLLDVDSADIDSFKLNGSSVGNASAIYLPTSNSIGESIGSLFSNSGVIYPQGSTFKSNTVKNTLATGTDGSVYVGDSTTLTNAEQLTFEEYTGKYAVHLPSTITGTIAIVDWLFDGTGTDFYWDGADGTSLIINLSGTSNASTYTTPGTATVTFQSSTTFKLTGLYDNTEVRIYTSDLATELYGIEDTSGGIITYVYGGTYTDAIIVIHNVDYTTIRLTVQLDGINASIPIQQQKDRWYDNPV